MKLRVKTKLDKLPGMEKAAKELKGKKISVGATGEHAWLMGIHEYGCRIPVTPKMRAFMHHMGVHLRKETTEIVIPERSFLRAGFDKHHLRVLKEYRGLLGDVLTGDYPVSGYLEEVGQRLAGLIQNFATKLKDPPNADLTVKGSEDDWGLEGLPGKKSSNPLVDTGSMIASINYTIE